MDKCTFGNSKAGINLVSILNKPENTGFAHTASRILCKYSASLKSLGFIPTKDIRETSYRLWRNHFLEWVDKSSFPTLVETHIKCVIVGQYREALREVWVKK